ncbi:mitochondrial 37S ribosomal protein nam9, partial [Ascosphaera atra]
MRFPGYLLNPGDMFQVDPEMVMFATGAPKTDKQRRGGRQRRLRAKQRREREEQEKEKAESEVAAEDGKKEEKSKPPKGAADALPEEKKPEASKDGENSGDDAAHRKALKELLNRAKAITEAEKNGIRPSRHRADFQEFRRLVRSTLSRSHSGSDQDVSDLEAQFSRLKLLVDKENEIHSKAQEGSSKDSSRDTSKTQNASATSQSSTQPTTPSSQADAAEATALQSALMDPNTPDSRALLAAIPASDLAILKQALYQVHENPIDTSKPYATPWRPKDYMAAFAFIPRYLEVNQNICAAVYVRHPVARPGLAEVPSPYPDA